jgi:hypothetical protein
MEGTRHAASAAGLRKQAAARHGRLAKAAVAAFQEFVDNLVEMLIERVESGTPGDDVTAVATATALSDMPLLDNTVIYPGQRMCVDEELLNKML